MTYHLFPRYIQATHLAAVVVHAELLADESRAPSGFRNLMGAEIFGEIRAFFSAVFLHFFHEINHG